MKFLFVFLIFTAQMTLAQTTEKILARWSDGWYVGVIAQKIGDKYKIIFDDGDQALVPLSGVKPLDWGAGSRVQCNWLGRGAYYPGTIIQMSGSNINVNYDDGDRETTVIGRCRTR